MTFLKSLALALSTFSTIPVPRVQWSGRNMRYMMCAFPLVGVVIGAAQFAWLVLFCIVSRVTGLQYAPVSHIVPLVTLLIPVALTGGIHLDGFMDTCDALASRADIGRKLEIMRDPRCGAFAVLGCVLYFLAQYALLSQFCGYLFAGGTDLRRFIGDALILRPAAAASLIFVQSRLLSALAVIVFPCARESGLACSFKSSGAGMFAVVWCVIWLAAVSILAVFALGRSGAAVTAASFAVFAWYFFITRRSFGGITGDTAGFFVQMSEIVSLAAAVLSSVIG